LQIDLSKQFRIVVRALPKARRREIAHAIDAARDGFGSPHLHSRLGIRRLRRNYFECRVRLQIRLIFRAEPGVLHFVTAGNHDHVRNFIKSI
jgi:mRNA-degrading endonuclease YafQ of YafQ-DinJ toxin-antitoxin module